MSADYPFAAASAPPPPAPPAGSAAAAARSTSSSSSAKSTTTTSKEYDDIIVVNHDLYPYAMSWQSCKQQGQRLYDRHDYHGALMAYQAALEVMREAPALERAVLLSNAVACRLQIIQHNTPTNAMQKQKHAAAAIQQAQECIALHPAWSKGYVRLASAYIAAGPQHSNDACNALQTALRLDPRNSTARQMLLRELRRDHAGAAAAAAASSNHGSDADEDDVTTPPPIPPPLNPNYIPPTTNSNNNDAYTAPPFQHHPAEQAAPPHRTSATAPPQAPPQAPHVVIDDDIDTVTWWDRLQWYTARAHVWYEGQSHETRLLLKAALVLLLLYVAMGGRFGLTSGVVPTSSPYSHSASSNNRYRGNYGQGNAYEQYYHRNHQPGKDKDSKKYRREDDDDASSKKRQRRNRKNGDDDDDDFHRKHTQQQQQQSSPYGSSSSSTYRDNYGYSGYGSGSSYGSYGGSGYGSYGSSHGYHGYANRGGGYSSYASSAASLPSMLMLLGVAYMCHRNGINPFHALWMMNIMNPNRRRRGMYWGGGFGGPGMMMGMGMGGMGMGGMMGGMGHHRRPVRW